MGPSRQGLIRPGGSPPHQAINAAAAKQAIEGAVIELSGMEPYDEELAARAAVGILGLDPTHAT